MSQDPGVDTDDQRARFRGCLLAGAAGDALGAPVEFERSADIVARYGPGGIRDYFPAYGRLGAITDDTQLTLFTAEGLLRAEVRGALSGIASFEATVGRAYLRWLLTQGDAVPDPAAAGEEGWLATMPELYQRRAPGLTCLEALRSAHRPGDPARNDSKGCGGVMRVAPVALFFHRRDVRDPLGQAFEVATRLAALTHGHPTGSLAAGAFAALVHAVLDDVPLEEAARLVEKPLRRRPRHEETLQALQAAVQLAARGLPPARAIPKLGAGWVADEALAIALYCALVADELEEALVLAVNHDGDSDSTGAMAGNLLGARDGEEAIPDRWLDGLELRDVITQLADDLLDYRSWGLSPRSPPEVVGRVCGRYPPG